MAVLAQTVTSTTLSMSSGGFTVASGGSIVSPAQLTLTATVVAGGTAITKGTVNFCVTGAKICSDVNLIGSAQLTTAGTASFTYVPPISKLNAGVAVPSSYTAVFIGTTANAKSSSAASTLTVTGTFATTSVLTSVQTATNPPPYVYTLTDTVTGNTQNYPTGTVSFQDTSDGNYVLGTSTIVTGSSKFVLLPQPLVSSATYPRYVDVGDLNGDGIPDIASANFYLNTSVTPNSSTVDIFFGKGDGTFTAGPILSVGATFGPQFSVLADFNNDGCLDVLAESYANNTILLFLNTKTAGVCKGTFQAVKTYNLANVSGPGGLAVGDFNRDGNLDFIVNNNNAPGGTTSNQGQNSLVFFGDGAGNFTAGGTLAPGGTVNPVFTAVGDYNNDGYPDVAIANDVSNTIDLYLNNGTGTFTLKTAIATPAPNNIVLAADLNQDGNLDLVSASGTTTNPITVWLGKGDGTFTQAANPPTGAVAVSSAAEADFNGDGIPDLVYNTTSSSAAGQVGVLLGKGDGTFTLLSPTYSTLGKDSLSLAVGDFNNDGYSDVVIGNYSGDTASPQAYPNGELAVYLAEYQTTGTATSSISGITVNGTTVNPHQVDAVFPTSSVYTTSTSNTVPLIPNIVTNDQLSLTENPASPTTTYFGQPVAFTATLAPYSAQGYTTSGQNITFSTTAPTAGTIGTVALSSGSAILNYYNLPVGTNTIQSSYAGDANFAASTSNTVQHTVVQAPFSNDSLTAAPSTSVAGTTVTATFFIPVPAGVTAPTGSVTFTSPGSSATFSTPTAFTATTLNGVTGYQVTTTTSTLPIGSTVPIKAVYAGDTNYAGGNLTTNVAVTQVSGTADKVSAATASIAYGTSDQLTYSIPVVAGAAVPAGTVVFTGGTGNTALGSATWPASPATGTCPGGSGTCYLLTDSTAPTNIPVGAPTTVTGTFTATAASGYASAAPTTAVTVAQAPLSADTLSVSPNPATSGSTVTVSFFIPVPAGDVAPTGPVTFSSPGATFSTPTAFTATTVNGVTGYIATATTTNLPTGTDTVTGTYTTTDPNYAGGPLTTSETINPAANTGDAVTASPSPTTVGSSTTLSFTIPVVNGAAAPTGTVAFTSGTTALGSATWPATPTIVGGNYVLTTTTTALPLTVAPATSTPVTATYTAGNASGYGSAAPTTSVVVNQVSGATDAVTPANATTTVGTADALTYSIPVVAGVPVPAGTISFTSGGTNLGSATWPASPATGTCPSGTGTCYLLADNPAPTNIPLTVAPATSTPIAATFTATAASGYASAAPTTAVVVGAAGGSGDTLTVANNPTTYGTADPLTFNIPASSGVPAPAGTVVFTGPGGVVLGTATWPATPTVTNGNYSLTVSPTNIPVGAPTTVTATFTASAASGYGSAAPQNTVTVNKVPVTPNDGISANPSATTSGQTVTLSFTVPTVNGTAPANTSTVTFTAVIGGVTTTLGTGAVTGTTANGTTTYTTTTTALPVGNDTVTGTFTGDGNYAGGALTTPVAISSNTTTDTVAVATNPTTVQSPDTIAFSIPVTNGAAAPTGTVAFTSGSVNLGSATWPATPTIANGNYVLSISTTALPLTVAPSTNTPVLATYTAGGTSGYSSTSASTTVVVNQVPAAGDAVVVANNPTTVGAADPITFSIPVVTGAPAPSGSVTFTSGSVNLGTVAWPAAPVTGACPTGGGTCYILSDSPAPTNLPLTVGPATSTPVTATFTATSNSGYASGASNTTVVVNPAGNAGDALTVATNPTTYGTADTLTFSIPVSSGVPAPAGTVVFTSPGGVVLGTATWPATPTQTGGNYVLSVSPTNIPVGAPTTVTSTFTASAGSGYSSAAPTATVTVNQVPIANDGISANPSATTSGQTVTLKFTVPNVNGTAPATTSTVTFTAVIGGVTTTLGTANVTGTTVGGVTTYTTTTTVLPVGNDTVTGTFTGDTNYAGGSLTTPVAVSSNTTTDNVTVATNPTTVASPDTITFSIPVTNGAAVPAGTVTFTSGGVTLGTATWPAAPTVTGGNYTLSISTTTLPLTVAPSTNTPVLATFAATGASGYASTTASTTVVVNQVPGAGDAVNAANTTTTVGTADPLTFSIPVVAGAPVPTGTVSFTSGTTNLGTATWPAAPVTGACPGGNGTCYLLADNPAPTNLPLTVAPATSTPVTATYTAGSGSGYASTTATTAVNVTPVGGTGAALTVANNPTTLGAADTLTFSIPVNAGAPAPAGTITFTGGGVTLGTATWPANATPVNGFYTIGISPTNIPLGNPTQLTATFAPTAGSGYGASAPTASVTVTKIPGTGDTLVSNPNPSTFGQTVTLTETIPTVNGLTPTGTVTFTYNGATIGTGTVNNGVATTTISTLPVGSDPISAAYTGDGNYAPVTSSVTQIVNVATAQATLAAGPNPATFGQTVTLTETLVPINGVCPPGPVSFFNNGVLVGTPATVNAQCVATITTNTLPVGSDAITATAPASGSFAAVTSGPVALVINKANGADTLASNPNPSTFGGNVTITDTIPTVGGVAPTGTVNFYSFGTLIGTGTVNSSGVATLVTGTLPVGTDSLTAIYQGDANYAQVTAGPVNQVVSPVSTSPTLSVGPNPTTFGTPVTVTETIPVVNGTPATGTVIFSQNGIVIGTGTINAQGVASFTTSTLPVGTDPITATYSGDTNYAAINSGPVNEVINKANGADTLAVNPDPAAFGSTVTITDTVPTVGGVAPTGTVTFTNNGTVIGTAPIVNGVATLTTTTLPVGSDPISAAYSGDNNYAAVTTGPVNEIITTGNTTPVLGATPNPTTFGTPVTLTESIPGINGVTPTGTVQFFNNGTLIGTGTVNAQGVATLVTSTLPIGTDPITAKYSGDTNYAAATTGPLNVVINKAAPVDTLSSAPSPTTFGTPVTATFTVPPVNGVVPTGTVSFYNGTTLLGTGNVNASGVATLTTSLLPVGTDTITAKYPGDNTYAPASPTATEVVGLATGTGDTLTTNPNPSNFGQTVTLTETLPTVGGVAPTGTVTFFYNGTQIGTGTVTNGVATTTTATLPVGSDPVTATYSGDGNYATVNSGPVTQVVNTAAGVATLTVNPNPATFGSPVTLTETIAPINGACPTGPATFLSNGTSIGTGTIALVGGKCVAILTTSTLPAGTDTITATVPASNGFAATASGPVSLVVAPATPVTTLTTNVPPATTPACGTSVTLTDTVTQINGAAVSGTVQFYNNGVAIGSPVPVSAGGVATLTTTTLPCGATNSITAIFTPSAGSPYGPSTAGPFALPIAAPDFAIAATPANQIVNPGDSAVYTVSLSGVTVPFTSPVTLTATCNCQGVTIAFANPTVTPGQGPTNTTMTVVTSPTFAMSKPSHGSNEIFYGLLLLPLLGLGKVRRKLRSLPKGISYCLAALVLLGGLGAVTGCGGGYYGPQPKTCTITITGTSGTLTHSTTVTVTVR
jgi:hypothetical protein